MHLSSRARGALLLSTLTACGGSIAADPKDDGGTGSGPDSSSGSNGGPNPPSSTPDSATVLTHPPAQHRPVAAACPSDRAAVTTTPIGEPSPSTQCQTDEDCTEGTNGRCEIFDDDDARECTYDECILDSDCGSGLACACGAVENGKRWQRNVCQHGTCAVDADCGEHGYCSPSFRPEDCDHIPKGYYCHTPQDECVDDADCDQWHHCDFDTSRRRWMCDDNSCSD